MVELRGKPLLHYQLEVLCSAGIEDISVVTGYKGTQVSHPSIGFKRFDNQRWQDTNMVASLDCASAELAGEVIVSYTDIVYQSSVVQALLMSMADIAVVVDTGFLPYWTMRFEDPLSDLESLQTNSNGHITTIGDKVTSVDDVEAQYIGLMKFSPAGSSLVRRTIEKLRPDAAFDRMFMTDLLRGLASTGYPVTAVPHQNGWLEVDSASDLALAEGMLASRQLIDPGKM